jgi:serine/threonine protein phosphatase PrpC
MLTENFESAAGSIVGRFHLGQNGLLKGQNNQDAFAIHEGPQGLIMVVCDGCGSEPYSEFGARLGADLLVAALRTQLARGVFWGASPSEHSRVAALVWERARQDVIAQLRVLALTLAGQGSITEYVSSRLLFTTVAAIVTPEVTSVASIGDGYVVLNEEVQRLGPFPDNTPPYLAYAMVDSSFSARPGSLEFQPVRVLRTEHVQSLLLASDGLEDVLACRECEIPGRSEKLGELSQFWRNDLFFKNKDALRRRLVLANSEVTKLSRGRGELERAQPLLKDDTTLVVLRRKVP